MRKSTFIWIVLMGTAFLLEAQKAPSFSVELSTDSILLGNYFTVTYTLENGQSDDVVFPEFTDFDVVGGPNYSSSVQIVNGEMSQSVSYTFYLEPRDIGEYYVEPASVEMEGQVLETLPVMVQVAPNPDGIIQQPQSRRERPGMWDDDFFQDFFKRDFGFPELMPVPMEPQDSTQQTTRKRKTTRL